ncbi:MAG: prepilin-type N-terminal cleavage/methylation domain-containing protein [Gemmatimonadaceae bacterium]
MPRFLVPDPASSTATRSGFSLVEVVIAILLLTIGALGVASTATASAALAASGRSRLSASNAVARVMDSLRATPCPRLAAGSITLPAGRITWGAVTGRNSADLTVTLIPASPRVRRSLSAQTVVPCE